jgi:mannosyl-oligosaccharide glucosidase
MAPIRAVCSLVGTLPCLRLCLADAVSVCAALRDSCEPDDGMGGFGWETYDPRAGGKQLIHDKGNQIDIATEFVKTADGQSWAVRVKGEPRRDASGAVKTAVIFHVAIEDIEGEGMASLPDKLLKCKPGDDITHNVTVACDGTDPALGNFRLSVFDGGGNKITSGPSIMGLGVTEDKIWQAKGECCFDRWGCSELICLRENSRLFGTDQGRDWKEAKFSRDSR